MGLSAGSLGLNPDRYIYTLLYAERPVWVVGIDVAQ